MTRQMTPADREVLTDAAIEAFDEYREILCLTGRPIVYRWSNRLTSSAGNIRFKAASKHYHIALSVPVLKGVLLKDGWAAAEAAVRDTMAHELCHVPDKRFGKTNGHGAEWRRNMRRCGYQPKRTHSYAHGAALFGGDGFRVGDTVEFEYKGEWFLGEIIKKNRKRAKVKLSDGAVWNVPYSRLE